MSAGASLSATDATVGNTVEVQGVGASFSVSDDLVLSVTLLQAADGGLIRLGGLTLTGSTSLVTDAASAIEIGSASLSSGAALLRQLVPRASVQVVPWQIQLPPLPALDDAARTGIAFIGGWAHAPNQDAIRFLLQAILPRLNSRLPLIPCSIIGAGVLEGYGGQVSPEVAIMGHVPDLATALGRVRLTVEPLRFGAGIKGKVLESFAHGLPCVMTPIAAEGLALDETLQQCVGQDLDHLVALIRSLHDDRARAMRAGAAGHRLVTRWNSAGAVDAALSRAVASPLAPVSRRKAG